LFSLFEAPFMPPPRATIVLHRYHLIPPFTYKLLLLHPVARGEGILLFVCVTVFFVCICVANENATTSARDTGKQIFDSEPLNVTEGALFGKSSNARDILLASLLSDLVDNGDFQHCSTVAAVIGLDGDENVLKGQVSKKVSKEQMEIWFRNYIDILHRKQLWAPAIEVIECSQDPQTSAMNSKNTTIESSCAECDAQLVFLPSNIGNGQGFQGSRARRTNRDTCKSCISSAGRRCSLCMQIVRGLMMLCPGCGHGGHEAHMRSWFKDNKECPQGCGHICNPFLFDRVHSSIPTSKR
jgi:hypothetical protein